MSPKQWWINMDKQISDLEQTLRQQLEAHGQLLGLMQGKLGALREAQHTRVAQCAQEENGLVQQIADLEKTRLEQVAGLTLLVQPDAPEPMRLVELAQHLPEPARARVLVLRHELRTRMGELQKQTGIARQATSALVSHMHGLMQSIGAAMSGVGTYEPSGSRPETALAVSTFNTTV